MTQLERFKCGDVWCYLFHNPKKFRWELWYGGGMYGWVDIECGEKGLRNWLTLHKARIEEMV